MLTTLNKYCSRCDMEEPEYRASYRTDMFAPHWSTPNGEEWIEDICHECRGHLEDMADDGVIWSLVYQRRFTTTKFHYERVGQ
jgi:hypothetical protein